MVAAAAFLEPPEPIALACACLVCLQHDVVMETVSLSLPVLIVLDTDTKSIFAAGDALYQLPHGHSRMMRRNTHQQRQYYSL